MMWWWVTLAWSARGPPAIVAALVLIVSFSQGAVGHERGHGTAAQNAIANPLANRPKVGAEPAAAVSRRHYGSDVSNTHLIAAPNLRPHALAALADADADADATAGEGLLEQDENLGNGRRHDSADSFDDDHDNGGGGVGVGGGVGAGDSLPRFIDHNIDLPPLRSDGGGGGGGFANHNNTNPDSSNHSLGDMHNPKQIYSHNNNPLHHHNDNNNNPNRNGKMNFNNDDDGGQADIDQSMLKNMPQKPGRPHFSARHWRQHPTHEDAVRNAVPRLFVDSEDRPPNGGLNSRDPSQASADEVVGLPVPEQPIDDDPLQENLHQRHQKDEPVLSQPDRLQDLGAQPGQAPGTPLMGIANNILMGDNGFTAVPKRSEDSDGTMVNIGKVDLLWVIIMGVILVYLLVVAVLAHMYFFQRRCCPGENEML